MSDEVREYRKLFPIVSEDIQFHCVNTQEKMKAKNTKLTHCGSSPRAYREKFSVLLGFIDCERDWKKGAECVCVARG